MDAFTHASALGPRVSSDVYAVAEAAVRAALLGTDLAPVFSINIAVFPGTATSASFELTFKCTIAPPVETSQHLETVGHRDAPLEAQKHQCPELHIPDAADAPDAPLPSQSPSAAKRSRRSSFSVVTFTSPLLDPAALTASDGDAASAVTPRLPGLPIDPSKRTRRSSLSVITLPASVTSSASSVTVAAVEADNSAAAEAGSLFTTLSAQELQRVFASTLPAARSPEFYIAIGDLLMQVLEIASIVPIFSRSTPLRPPSFRRKTNL